MSIIEYGSFRIAALRLALISDNEHAVADGFQYWVELFSSSEFTSVPSTLEPSLEVA